MRPSKYTNELAEKICLEIIEGKSIREICKSDKYPCMATIFNWLNTNIEFLEQYERAKEIQADVMAEDILSIADNTDGEVQRDRLRIDARKWIASKLKPKKYGGPAKQEIDTREALKPAKEMTLLELEQAIKNASVKDLSRGELMVIARGGR